MPESFSRSHFDEAAAAIRQRARKRPRVGLILGSGLDVLAEGVEGSVTIPYGDIPHFPATTVEGHTGCLVAGRLAGQAVAVLQGRVHYYEGYSMAEVTFPVRVLQVLGIETLIVTNAAGGLNTAFRAGDVMLITDHINLIGMGGANPLRGPNLEGLGPRFPDMSEAYDARLRVLAGQVAASAEIPLQEGVYVCLSGPNFETPADQRFLRLIGADAVGMSTVPEVIVARHAGIRVLGFSCITNIASPDGAPPEETTHEEVLKASHMLAPRLETLIRGVLGAL